jgi:nucleoid-associated protein YgaU
VPATIPREGVPYKIRWGDTLWDIAAAFYRNPWLYPRIARFNNIRNPNLIISGTTIRIPPKN